MKLTIQGTMKKTQNSFRIFSDGMNRKKVPFYRRVKKKFLLQRQSADFVSRETLQKIKREIPREKHLPRLCL